MSFFRRRAPPAETPPPGPAPAELVAAYHERTKHHGHRFAASPGFLDWDNQPDPFRRHDGAALYPLPRPQTEAMLPYEGLFMPGSVPAQPLSPQSLSEFFYYSLALSAWKRAGEAHWALRVNPSSGNLHPTEGWALLPALPGLSDAPGLYHYQPKEHALVARARFRAADFAALLPAGPRFFVALSSVPWREAWKYGERAWRYCQHDVGHALAALSCSAALLGWRVRCLPAVDDSQLAALLGLDRDDGSHPEEPEYPDLLALVECVNTAGDAAAADAGAGAGADAAASREALASLAQHATWTGRANLCSPEHRAWEVIDTVEAATRKDAAWCAATQLGRAEPKIPSGRAVALRAPPASQAPLAPGDRSAGAVIRGRRSAVSLDGHTGLTAEGFVGILAHLMPGALPQPWAALGAPPLVDLALFVHRVRDVEPGLYVLVREPSRVATLRASLAPDLLWTPAPAAPAELPLFLLRAGNAQNVATSVSCGQDIAGRGAFSLGMLASFAPALAQHGAPIYRHLFWETGFIGQILYLEAEALGIAGTGIGCFFDDAVHQVLGLRDKSVQSLYHFTVGGAVLDERLTTEPAYEGPGVP